MIPTDAPHVVRDTQKLFSMKNHIKIPDGKGGENMDYDLIYNGMILKYKQFESNSHYYSVTEDFFYMKKEKRLNFSVIVYDKIENLLNDKWVIEIYENKATIFRKGKKKNSLYDTLIFLSDDEWYFVRVGGEKYTCYKCDQIDGLLKLLNDLKLINDSKIYESFGEKFYIEISKNEYNNFLLDNESKEKFEKDKIEYLKEYCNKNKIQFPYHIQYSMKDNDYKSKDVYYRISIDKNENKLTIYSAKDDWYICEYTQKEPFKGYGDIKFYYKCDQWDGLMQLIDDFTEKS